MTTTENLELELVSGKETFDTDKVMNNFTKIDTAVGNLQDGVGNVESLTTTVKTDLVAAINEVDGNIGDLSGLSTTAKTNLVAAVNELNQNMNVIGVLWDKQGNLTLSVANTFEKVMEISDLPAGTYIAIVRMQRNSASAPSTVMSWISVASNTESPSAGPSNGVTIPGGTSYPGTSLTRIIELTTSGSIGAWVQSTDISALFTGMMQVIRIK